MKKIKWITTIIIIIGMATNSFARVARTPATEAKQLQLELKLTDLQTTKITTVLQQIDKEQGNDKVLQANMKNWRATHNTKAIVNYILKQMDANAFRIEKVLTAEQKEKFQEMVEKHRDGFKKMAAAQN